MSLSGANALIRRYHTYNNSANGIDTDDDQYISISGIRITTTKNEVYKNDIDISLTELEYQILLLMMRQPGRLFSARDIYERVWKVPYIHTCNATVLVHIRNLRVKLEEDPGNPKFIKTIWGKGYFFDSK